MKKPLLLRLADYYERRENEQKLLQLAKYSEKLLLYYLNQVPCVFAYRLADTPENRKRGRAGQLSGYRTGVRNPNFIPASKQAKTNGFGTRYYDEGRQNWRSWRSGNLVTVTAFWSVEQQRFVETPEEAGIVAGVEFKAKPLREPVVSQAKADRIAKREAAKRERETIRKNLKARK
ncbi:hypothetical protein [Hymenobacter fodinae]|uniref:Uncharacterized protein n=1 Tax=Hymenobacter fodinae TaxID=2510796 RepID=A0A4Z0P8C3_9BACT|nr:hypothetical protein [Hymenobacter fodinae]TGE08250.1 hypothetical protein EU556_11040 [Hymenobacter fodinae]